jgi:hypothetical protein
MSISAMKCALQSLESVEKVKGWNKDSVIGRHCSQSAHFLRQAIEQAEKQEPVGYLYDWLNPDSRDEVIRDWFAASTYVIEKDKGFNVRPLYTAPVHAIDMSEKHVHKLDKDRHEWAMQKMVDENQRLGLYDDEQPTCQENRQVAKSATTEWVGLTDGEMQEAMEYWSDSLRSSYGGAESASEEYVDMVLTWRYIEAKLREKNT